MKTFLTFFKNLNASIDAKADHFVAKYHDRAMILFLMVSASMFTIFGAIVSILYFLGIMSLKNNEWAVWHYGFTILQMFFLPQVVMWSVHIFRIASWHLYRQMEKALED